MLNHWDRTEIAALLRECGKTALDYSTKLNLEIKSDRTVVTQADRAIEKYISARLESPEDGVYMIGEESETERPADYFRKALENTAWIVDPIDGTAVYVNGLPMWGISIGFARKGTIEEGAVFLPVTNELILSDKGKVYYDNGSGLAELPGRVHPFDESSMLSISQKIVREGLYHGVQNLQSIGSCVYPGLMMARGFYTAMLVQAKLWDMAGILPVLAAFGYVSMNRRGTNVLSLKITGELYEMDFASRYAFRAHCHSVIAPNADICRRILDLCELPEDRKKEENCL